MIRTALLGAATFAALAGVGARTPHATTPCPPYWPVRLTGTLIEVREGDTVVANEQALQAGALPRICVTPTFGNTTGEGRQVTFTDCETNPSWPFYTLVESP